MLTEGELKKKVDAAQIHYIVTQHSISNETISAVTGCIAALMLLAYLLFG